ncbi:MAG: Unknown protein [uncultured Thiotrichaceae bacterium]|uniref:DUF937 domain-containing protein n=1 Tax=uncultured Thiotrichaceae bacterium TaxID=298394 RepID=A0A6S6UDS7_9GAMM|nr:MAG: Unknown protein [uncultured Thiotrichaceae bacterium]
MDISNIVKMGASAFTSSKLSGDAGSNLNSDTLTSALGGLLGGNDNEGSLDLGSLLSGMQSGGLGDIAKSWLGDGENESISIDQITSMLGSDKISEFASQLGVSDEEAAGGLADALPQMVDNASSGGSILDSIGGVSGAIGMASKFFGR